MNVYFCLVPRADYNGGLNIGRTYAYEHRSEWISCDEAFDYLAAGYVLGVDHASYDGKAYMLKKTYIDLEEKFVVHVCLESIQGCDK